MATKNTYLSIVLAGLVFLSGCDDDSDSSGSTGDNGGSETSFIGCDGIDEGLRSDVALDDSLSPVAFDPTMAYCLSGELTSEEGRISRQFELSPGSYTLSGPNGKAFAYQVRPVDVSGSGEAIDGLHVTVYPVGDEGKEIVFAASRSITVEVSATEWADEATSIQNVKDTFCSACESIVAEADVALALASTGTKLSNSPWKDRWQFTIAVPDDAEDSAFLYTTDMMETAYGLFYEPVAIGFEGTMGPVGGTDPVGLMFPLVLGDIGDTIEISATSASGFYMLDSELTVNSEGTEITGEYECIPPNDDYSCPGEGDALGVSIPGFAD